MIQLFGLLGIVAFAFASLIVGFRIIQIAVRTRGLPETTLGGSLFIAGGFGTLMVISASLVPDLAPHTVYVLGQLSILANHLGYALLLVFVWRVFRPTQAWATALFAGCLTVLLAGGAGMSFALTPGEDIAGVGAYSGPWFIGSMIARSVSYTWAASESFAYYLKLRRRIPLGLAEPETANRFLYWGISLAAVDGIWINMLTERFLPAELGYVTLSRLITTALGLIIAAGIWMAFVPARKKRPTGETSPSPASSTSHG